MCIFSTDHLQAAGVLHFKMHMKPLNVLHEHFGWLGYKCAGTQVSPSIPSLVFAAFGWQLTDVGFPLDESVFSL